MALLGQKWVPHIIHELMSGKRRFNELAHNIGGCNSRTLRDRLKNLEELGVVERHIVAVMPPWVAEPAGGPPVATHYDQLGRVTAQQIVDWSHEHMAAYKVPRIVQFVDALPKSGRPAR